MGFLNILVEPVSYDTASLLFRLAIGLALLPYGIKKICTRENADKFFKVLFFSPSQGYFAALLIETLAPICLIFGFLTRLAAIAGMCNMGIAFTFSKDKYLTSPATAFCLGFIAVAIVGPGAYSIDHFLFG